MEVRHCVTAEDMWRNESLGRDGEAAGLVKHVEGGPQQPNVC